MPSFLLEMVEAHSFFFSSIMMEQWDPAETITVSLMLCFPFLILKPITMMTEGLFNTGNEKTLSRRWGVNISFGRASVSGHVCLTLADQKCEAEGLPGAQIRNCQTVN